MVTATAQVFRLPDLGEGLTEAELVQWLVNVGDTVALDQAIAEVETAKSVVELPSPFPGVVVALHGAPGDTIAVGQPVIEVDDGSGPAAPESSAAGPSEPLPSEAAAKVEIEAYREEEKAGSGNVLIGYGTSAGAGAVRRRARAPKSSGTSDATSPAPPAPTVAPPAPEAVSPAAAKPRVPVRSPLLRRLARDLGVDLGSVDPTSPDGVITRTDILRAATTSDGPGNNGAAATASRPVAAPPAGVGELPAELGRERMSMLRRAVSAKMSRSRSEIPEATVWVDVDATDLWAMRSLMTADAGQKPPSFTALLARFTLLALAEYPLLASRLTEDAQEIIRYDGVNLGVAADTERGLMVPVIPAADRMNVAELDSQLKSLAGEAKAGQLPPERLRGSTFTLNNYGSLGVDGSAAVINHPEVAILGVGRMIERPWVVDGAIVPRRIVQISLVFDHRVCDGGYAAGFIRHIVNSIERPASLFPRL